jgi:hypothetical protein
LRYRRASSRLGHATIKEEFNTYQFADYKGEVITLVSKVIKLCMHIGKITNALGEVSPLKPEQTGCKNPSRFT